MSFAVDDSCDFTLISVYKVTCMDRLDRRTSPIVIYREYETNEMKFENAMQCSKLH